jgi:cobalt/nickel transport system ATP-binding protein
VNTAPSKTDRKVLVDLKGVSFSYPGGGPVFENLDFRLCEREKVGLVGPNGTGKTTLFHLIVGLLVPTSGTIELFGKPVTEEKEFRVARQRIGLLFQDADDQLFCPTVLEDVAFGPLNQGRTAKEATEIAKETVRSLGLEGLESRVTHKLSGGEKKLVALATILAMKPEVLLLDEPTTALDFETTERIIKILSKIELSFVFISHNMDFILQTAEKIYGMEKGHIVLEEENVPHTHIHAHSSGRLHHTHLHDVLNHMKKR